MTGPGDDDGGHVPPDEFIPLGHDDYPQHLDDGELGGIGGLGADSPLHVPPAHNEQPSFDAPPEPMAEHIDEREGSHLELSPPPDATSEDEREAFGPVERAVLVAEGPLESPHPFAYELAAEHFPGFDEKTFDIAPDGSRWIDPSWLRTDTGPESAASESESDVSGQAAVVAGSSDPSAGAVLHWLRSQ